MRPDLLAQGFYQGALAVPLQPLMSLASGAALGSAQACRGNPALSPCNPQLPSFSALNAALQTAAELQKQWSGRPAVPDLEKWSPPLPGTSTSKARAPNDLASILLVAPQAVTCFCRI